MLFSGGGETPRRAHGDVRFFRFCGLIGGTVADSGGRCSFTLAGAQSKDCPPRVSTFSPHGKHLMFLNPRSPRFLTRSLAMAFAVACGVSLSSVAQAQMATGSGCTNCGGASSPVVTYSSAAPAQYSQSMTQQSYPASTTVVRSYPSSSHWSCASTQRRCSSSRRSAVHYRQPSSSCGTTYSNAAVYSSGSCGSGCGSSTTVNRYPTSGVSNNAIQVSAPVMQTGAGCASGNCR
ncbi:hypothetical protein Pla52o_56830 [Novipirellula galeiformis]|uniref:Uncharacterized protein n=2 Tax=Novipirellula galeiformis TaxID=2528004 RepID=A0A5C6BEH0_9BACT|nr:hypothetical protein Pla52o_56830 [Novipirellula galeiformis]